MREHRFSREDPERTDPIRNFSGAFRSRDPADEGDVEDFVTSGVRMGYRLVEDQIRRGQRAARRMGGRVQSSRSDFRDFTERVFRFYGDLCTDAALFWFDISTGAMGPFDEAEPAGLDEEVFPPDSAMGASAGPPIGGTAFLPMEIASARPVRVKLNLQPGAESLPLDVVQPRARDVAKPPLMNVSFVPAVEGTVLVVRVPDDQPADIYHGVVCHRDSGEQLGALSVEIRPF